MQKQSRSGLRHRLVREVLHPDQRVESLADRWRHQRDARRRPGTCRRRPHFPL